MGLIMPAFIAMLRGINVSGRNIIKMEDLRRAAEALGPERVETYLQSGNVLFRADGTAKAWGEKLERRLAAEFGLQVPVIARTAGELGNVLTQNPFLTEKNIDLATLHVFFCSAIPAKAGLAGLDGLSLGQDRFAAIGREVYLHCPYGYGKTKLSNAALEKKLSVTGTTRNWNTVTNLAEMAWGL
jgi:uncharacterized protein (DUF1697 family)